MPLSVLVLILMVANPALAEMPAGPAAQDAPLPFDLSEVPAEEERLARLHVTARLLAKTDPVIEALREAATASARELAPLWEELREVLDRGPRLDELADVERAWLDRRASAAAWRAALDLRLGNLESTHRQLVSRRGRWQATLAHQRELGAPDELQEAMQAALDEIVGSDRMVSASLGRLFSLQQVLSGLEAGIDEAVDAIRASRGAVRARLFEPDEPPLWAVRPAEEPTQLIERARGSAGTDFRTFLAWWRAPDAPRGLLAGLVLGALALILTLRARSRRWAPDDPRREQGRLLLRRPWSMALVAGFSMAALITPIVPRPVLQVMGLFFLLPALRVLSVAVPERFHGFMAGLAGFYVFDRARGFLGPLELLERWMLLLELLAALAVLLWMLRPQRLQKDEAWQLTSPLLLWLVTRLGVILLALAATANVLGFVDLSRVVGEGVLHSAYLGVVVVGVLQVGRNFLAIVLGSENAKALRMIRLQPRRVERVMRRGMAWATGLTWVHLALGLLAVREMVYGTVIAVLTTAVPLGEVKLRLGDPVLVVAVLWAAIQLSRLLRFMLQEEVFPRVRMQRGVPNALSTMLHYGVMLLGLWIAFSAIGLEWDRMAIVFGALSVGIGFGLQSVVNNFVSGLILLFERPVQVGDTIQLGEVHGDVRRIGARSSTIRTWDGSEIIVPNADLVSQQVTNWTLSDRRRRIDMDFGVAYGTDPAAVQAILREAASQHAEVLENPAPEALFTGFGDSALLFQLRAWVRDPAHWMTARSDINVVVNAALAEAGIEIPFPQRDIHFRTPLESRPGDETDPTG